MRRFSPTDRRPIPLPVAMAAMLCLCAAAGSAGGFEGAIGRPVASPSQTTLGTLGTLVTKLAEAARQGHTRVAAPAKRISAHLVITPAAPRLDRLARRATAAPPLRDALHNLPPPAHA